MSSFAGVGAHIPFRLVVGSGLHFDRIDGAGPRVAGDTQRRARARRQQPEVPPAADAVVVPSTTVRVDRCLEGARDGGSNGALVVQLQSDALFHVDHILSTATLSADLRFGTGRELDKTFLVGHAHRTDGRANRNRATAHLRSLSACFLFLCVPAILALGYAGLGDTTRF